MKLSVICCTYARVNLLQKALHCFLEQDYPDKELIIFNSCPKQTLEFNHPKVKVWNEARRPASLGQCRNLAIQQATGDVIVTLDDDDFILKHHLSNIARRFNPGIEWVWPLKMYYAEKFRIKDIVVAGFPCFAFSLNAFVLEGGYKSLTVGEDRDLVERITSKHSGTRTPEVSFVYNWDTGQCHASGLGEDAPGKIPARYWIENDFRKRAANGKEPTGHIVLRPTHTGIDEQADQFTSA